MFGFAFVSAAVAAPAETVLYRGVEAIGDNPQAPAVFGPDGNLYSLGVGYSGVHSAGSIFQVTPSGTASLFYSFTGSADGGAPISVIVGTDGNFYGTTSAGGSNNAGTVFKVTAQGTFVWAYSFSQASGGTVSGLVEASDGNFYGNTQAGSGGCGILYQITPAGVFTVLHVINQSVDVGCNPSASLVQANDHNLYGVTYTGATGSRSFSTIFRSSLSGSYRNVRSLVPATDGEYPLAPLIQGSDGRLYGTASQGGANNNGTVFAITLGGAFTTLHAFAGGLDGSMPYAPVVELADGTYVGTTLYGDSSDANGGVIYDVSASGNETVPFAFSSVATGLNPKAGLTLSRSGIVYGTTRYGGSNASTGAVFEITGLGDSSGSVDIPTDGPLPLWAYGALSLSLFGIASHRIRRASPGG